MKTCVPFVRGQNSLLVSIVLLSLAFRASSVDLLVYNKNDSGAGSLRQAISDNNALGGGNTVVFSNIVSGTITLTGGQLLIAKDVTVDGPGASVLAIDGNNASRVFFVTNPAVADLSGLTITNALGSVYGGGILTLPGSTVTVSNCAITHNLVHYGGGIANEGTLTVVSSTIDKNSGGDACGIYNFGTLIALSCTFSGNTNSDEGGAIINEGVMTLTNCTFSGNLSKYGGAIYCPSTAGSTTSTIVSCTFSGNAASTLGDCIFLDGNLTIGNTILNGTKTNIYKYAGVITSLGYNLCSDNGGGYLTGAGDQINTAPNLGPLQNNGGPTLTMAPLSGSPALDQGKSLGLAEDQRGRPRPFDQPGIPNAAAGDGSDIGAVEIGAVTLTVIDTNDSGAGSLRQAILNASPIEGDTITFSPNVTNVIKLMSGELLIGNSLTIQGPGAKMLSVDGNGSNRVFHLTSGNVEISGLTITNGFSSGVSGGGILNDHTSLTLSNCFVTGNSTTVNGGALYNNGISNGNSTLVLIGCAVSGNSASIDGGAIFNAGPFSGSASLTISASTISSNSASLAGGIHNSGRNSGHATVTILGSTLAGNTASSGGGIYLDAQVGGFSKLEIGDTILRSGASGANILSAGGTVVSDGYNLSSDGASGLLTNATDQLNTDPMLGPLKDNGGPTPTMALLSGSPAIDKGKSFGVATDQRGAPRPFDFAASANAPGGDASDIGAFELGSPTLNIRQVDSNAVLSWPWFYGDFTLQSSTNFTSSSVWSAAGGTPVVVGNQYQQTNSLLLANHFFRLQRN